MFIQIWDPYSLWKALYALAKNVQRAKDHGIEAIFYPNFVDIGGCSIIQFYWFVIYMKIVFENFWILNQMKLHSKFNCGDIRWNSRSMATKWKVITLYAVAKNDLVNKTSWPKQLKFKIISFFYPNLTDIDKYSKIKSGWLVYVLFENSFSELMDIESNWILFQAILW